MALAVLTARRGWVEPRHVLNARPLSEVQTLLAELYGPSGKLEIEGTSPAIHVIVKVPYELA